jgi:hydrogenase maturation protease
MNAWSADSRDRVALIGLGNALRGDDAIGLAIADRVVERLSSLGEHDARACLDLHRGALDALAIVAAWSDAAMAIVVDAAVSGAAPGSLHRFELGADAGAEAGTDRGATPLRTALGSTSSHGLGLAEAIALGAALGRLPPRLVCFAVEAQGFDAASGLSRPVENAVHAAVAQIADEIIVAWHHRQLSPPRIPRGARPVTD